MSKKDDGAKNELKRKAIEATLLSLVGKTYASMSKTQQDAFVTVLGQIVDLMDADGKVKPLS